MKAVSAGEMQRIDRVTIDESGIPAEVLMGLAGKAVADSIETEFGAVRNAAVFSGTGNNGGDGFVAAYILAQRGIRVDIFLAGTVSKVSPVSAVYLKACRAEGIPVYEINNSENLSPLDLSRYDILVDALFGTGFQGSVRGIAAEIIGKINTSGAKVLSVDIPSGLPSDGGAPAGEVVRASCTVTIGLPKISLVTYPGKEYAGRLCVADIGFPRRLTMSEELSAELVDAEYARKRLAVSRSADVHKGSAGHLLLIGGFDSMEGAILMTAMAALETGIGLITLLTTERARAAIAGIIPELITRSIHTGQDDEKNSTDLKSRLDDELEVFFAEERRYDAVILGPGMGRGIMPSMVFSSIMKLIARKGINRVLVDGDGLFHLAEYLKENRLEQGSSIVITPHFYEASRLFTRTVDEIRANRFDAAGTLAHGTGCVVLLKGPASIISSGKQSLINTSGNPALATAGSGDVLSGITGALMLRDMPVLEAAGIGAYIHGRAADLYVQEHGIEIMKATDIVKYIREVLGEIINNA